MFELVSAPDTSRPSSQPTASAQGRTTQRRVPALREAAQGIQRGHISAQEYARLVHDLKPVCVYDHVPEPASRIAIASAVDAPKTAKVGVAGQTIAAGAAVGLRLDIPSFTRHGVWVISVHLPRGNGVGPVVAYEACMAINDVTMSAHQGAALKIAAGAPKSPMAMLRGSFVVTNEQACAEECAQALESTHWVQVGMDPERHAYFYDRATQRPIIAARRVVQVGPLAMALAPVYADPAGFLF